MILSKKSYLISSKKYKTHIKSTKKQKNISKKQSKNIKDLSHPVPAKIWLLLFENSQILTSMNQQNYYF